MKIPESELEISFARSGGPGGQNVNKVETKVLIRWNFAESAILSEFRKGKLLQSYPDGIMTVTCQETRSQLQNRVIAVERLEALVTKLLTPRKVRRPTRISKGQREKRLALKGQQGERKRLRSKPSKGEG